MKKHSQYIVAFIFLAIFSCKTKKETETTVTYHPNYHYTSAKNWVNDPNGMVYLDGEYHLFYQYNPFGDKWGHMSWGHAVSKDLKTWEELPVAIPEVMNADSSTTMVFSGSAVVDSLNTTGFFEKGFKSGMVAIYTAHIDKKGKGIGQSQSLAYSADKGRTWKFYDKNPVLDIKLTDFRDPSVFWHEGKWKMIVVKALEYTAQIYESADLKNWKLLSEFGKIGDYAKIWECPSLFKVPVENSDKLPQVSASKWISMISSAHEDVDYVGMQYFVGDFDGKKFTPDAQTGVLRIDHGKDFYAAVPFNSRPANQKYPIIMAWNNNWAYAGDLATESRRGMFSMPRMVSLIEKNGKYEMVQKPIFAGNIETQTLNLSEKDSGKTIEMKGNSYRLNLTIDTKNSKGFSIDLLKNGEEKSVVSYDISTQKLSFDRTKSGVVDFNKKFPSIESMKVEPENGIIKLDIFVDNSIVEIFANDGKAVISDLVFPTKGNGFVEFSIKK
jgi:fructan beta-fructosidase